MQNYLEMFAFLPFLLLTSYGDYLDVNQYCKNLCCKRCCYLSSFTLCLSDLGFQEVGVAKVFETTPSATEVFYSFINANQTVNLIREEFGTKEISKEYRSSFTAFEKN